MVSVNVDLTAQSGVQAYDFAITYDNSVLSVASMNTGPSFSSAFIFDSSVNEGAGLLLEGGFGFVNSLQVQVGDALVQFRDREIGIECSGLLKRLEAFLEKLLVHVRGAEVVHAGGLDWIGSFRLRLGSGGKEGEGG